MSTASADLSKKQSKVDERPPLVAVVGPLPRNEHAQNRNFLRILPLDWHVKWAITKALEHTPGGHFLHYLMQRKVARSLPRKLHEPIKDLAVISKHISNFETHAGGFDGKRLFEFGAGWDLMANMAFWCNGLDRQVVVDIQRLLKPELVDDVIGQFGSLSHDLVKRRPSTRISQDPIALLARSYGIDYRAPCDARASGLDEACIDLVASTSVLEHVPVNDIAAIYKELLRICKPGAVLSLRIDYQDHYWYADKSIGPYNFLSFSKNAWKKYNTAFLYQNRLRHIDHINLIRDAGFEIIVNEPMLVDDAQTWLSHIELDEEFSKLAQDEILWTEANIVAIRP